MLLADLDEQRMIPDHEIKHRVSTKKPYEEWINQNLRTLDELTAGHDTAMEHAAGQPDSDSGMAALRRRLFGYSLEDVDRIIQIMAETGRPPIGSMGNDTPLAVLSNRSRLLFDYFKQLFAQVTNPPLDAIREELVTSTGTQIGARQNLLAETAEHARQIRCETPVLKQREFEALCHIDEPGLKVCRIDTTFERNSGGPGLEDALEQICRQASRAVERGCTVLILSDRSHSEARVPIPTLLGTGAVHHHLIRSGQRADCSIVVEAGDVREVHHFCLLLGFGASAVHPYVALQTASDPEHYCHAVAKGILKVMSKMGISTLQSYSGAQIFEAVGLAQDVVSRYFTGVPSRLEGVGLDVIAREVQVRHDAAYIDESFRGQEHLDVGGIYQWRQTGEHHALNPRTIASLQHAVRSRSEADYEAFASEVNAASETAATLRGLLDFDDIGGDPVPIEEVEHWTSIVRRFKTGAMSYGSISGEAHETLALAMNRIGGKSNTGEGGEPPERYHPHSPSRSRIKQVASGRFGVTIGYLASADEIQIKMAQGAKPGEGGQLPGNKVYPWIAETRHSTPWVGLISPPPHHDIYSIEDLAQLIFDLKNANPKARVTVKLVSEAGVGTIAAGVAKAKADVVLISGHDGGTGAAPLGSVMHAGLPWELGLSETHQTLVLNGLRSRIRIECDGQLKTGRDVAIAALLGADEFGFATAPLVAMGCIMMRKCHLNTCPVGIATQDPELRQRFAGEPEHVINYFYFVASELRQIMAALGFRKLDEMVGRVDFLKQRTDVAHWKARYLDLSPILFMPETPAALLGVSAATGSDKHDRAGSSTLIEQAESAIEGDSRVEVHTVICNSDRAFGTALSSEIARRRGGGGLRDDQIRIRAEGSAGQSCGAFLSKGVTIHIVGEVNDYLGKGLSGGRLVVTPPARSPLIPNMNIIAGNVGLYGATSGEVFIRGQAGERFAVRNSGVRAVVEGVGDHGCEYMTGGRIVILGPTGRNFAAGMSGGIAYVMDGTREFRETRCNHETVELLTVSQTEDQDELFGLVQQHVRYTDSDVGRWVLQNWPQSQADFVKVFPTEYRLALERLANEEHGLSVDGQVAA
jgi:glutamate synthase domain-containing protein 2/glutamate synthase domain-containing protein 3